jgi:hypothetical protein
MVNICRYAVCPIMIKGIWTFYKVTLDTQTGKAIR